MMKIQLTQGKFALVDNDMFGHLSQWKWYFTTVGYAARYAGTGRNNRIVRYMHQQINKTPKGMITDHINRNKLDNRKDNLRSIKRGNNQYNRGLSKNNSSGYSGVVWYRAGKAWQAKIKVNYKDIHLGYFKSLLDAVYARKQAELKYFIYV